MKDKKPVQGDFWKVKNGKVNYTYVVSRPPASPKKQPTQPAKKSG